MVICELPTLLHRKGVLLVCPWLVWYRRYRIPIGAYVLGLRYHFRFLPARLICTCLELLPATPIQPTFWQSARLFGLYCLVPYRRWLSDRSLYRRAALLLRFSPTSPHLTSPALAISPARLSLHDHFPATDNRPRASQTRPTRHLHAARIHIAGPCATPVPRSFC